MTTGASFTSGDLIAVALDLTAGTAQFYKNNVATGALITGLTGAYTPAMNLNYYPSNTIYLNCGQRPFNYAPPTGFLPLHTGNFSTPVIKKPNQYFDINTYAGTSAIQTIINSGAMQPDLVWIKGRSTAYNHILQDSVRGVGSTGKKLTSNFNEGEASSYFDMSYGYVDTINANGFSLNKTGTGGNDWASMNKSGDTYVAWQWKRGTIPGFDIVTYTGDGNSNRLIPHGLGVTPKFYMTKNRDGYNASQGFNDWGTYHQSLPTYNSGLGRQNVWLHSTLAAGAAGGINLVPTASVFTPVIQLYDNVVGRTYIAYLFAEVEGFSKFGSYTGNASANGPFVYCGFRPKYIMIKRTDGGSNSWYIRDTTRNTYNVADLQVYADAANAEAVEVGTDILSNGFKIRGTSVGFNGSGATYIFIAFAEAPFKYALAR